MLHGWIIDPKEQTFREIEAERLQQFRQDNQQWTPQQAGQLLWIDMSDPTEEDFNLLAGRMHLHPAVIDNLRQTEGRPKIQQYQKYFHLTAYVLCRQSSAADFQIELQEVDLLVGADYVITMHQGKMPPWQKLAADWQNNPPHTEGGIAYLVYELLDSIMDGYFPVLDEISDRLDELEDILFEGNGKMVTSEIFSLKRMLIHIRQVASPMREVVGQLTRHYSDDRNTNHVFFQDLYDHAMRIIDSLDSFRDILSSAMDVYLAAESNRMNGVMKTLTSFSIIFLPPTLIAGIYGMNFRNMPELHQRNGYFICIAIMVISMLGLYVYAKRRDWI